MKRIRMLELCVVAVFGFSAIAATTAQAALPEFLICGKVHVKGSGAYGTNCLGGPKQGDYELFPFVGTDITERKLEGKSGVTYLTGYGKPNLLSEAGTGLVDFVTCTKGSAKGQIDGEKTDELTFTWSKCSVSKGAIPCQSGVKAGEIKTSLLEGELGFEQLGPRVEMKYGAKNAGEPFVSFNCGGPQVEFKGDVIAAPSFINMPLKENPETMLVTPGGEPREMTFNNAPLTPEPNAREAGFPEFNWGIETTTKLKDDKALEIKAS